MKDEVDLPKKISSGKTTLHQPFSNLSNDYTKAINKRYHRSGSLFQSHPKKIKIENEDYLKNLIIYVNTNPYHHDVGDYLSYKYSSYMTLISNNKSFLERRYVISLFNDVSNFEYVHRQKKNKLDGLEGFKEIED